VSGLERLADERAHAYLDLLEIDARPGEVDAATVRALQRAHVGRVPYETIDIVRGAPPGIDPIACADRILAGRGGYCYHLNGAFATLLEWLEVDVTRHLAGVQNRTMAEPRGADGNHLGLTVRTSDGAMWLVDVGLGDGPPEPLPLAVGVYEQDGYRYELMASACVPGGWRFEHDERGAFVGFDMAPQSAVTADFAEMHGVLSTGSRFAEVPSAQRRIGGRVEVLRGCVYTETTARERRSRDVEDAEEWWALVTEHFGLAYGDVGAAERAALWRRVRAGHDAWVAEGRP
jgi:N-hydroxyarylamine O-acetyltransferase